MTSKVEENVNPVHLKEFSTLTNFKKLLTVSNIISIAKNDFANIRW
jgi:hypothetical protein